MVRYRDRLPVRREIFLLTDLLFLVSSSRPPTCFFRSHPERFKITAMPVPTPRPSTVQSTQDQFRSGAAGSGAVSAATNNVPAEILP